jgi:nitrile hydratase accessory protein
VSTDERLDLEGPAAPPRANGELVFDAPWQTRVFGLTHALCDRGSLDWNEFREQLIAEIAAFERAHSDADYRYWDCWLRALEHLLDSKQLCATAAQHERVATYATRPHGHDH